MLFSKIQAVFGIFTAVAIAAPSTRRTIIEPIERDIDETYAWESCGWFGKAPFCAGVCPAGWRHEISSEYGNGQKCYIGEKVYCCHDVAYIQSLHGSAHKKHQEVAGYDIEITVTKKDSKIDI